jgi:hypothetical protein
MKYGRWCKCGRYLVLSSPLRFCPLCGAVRSIPDNYLQWTIKYANESYGEGVGIAYGDASVYGEGHGFAGYAILRDEEGNQYAGTLEYS